MRIYRKSITSINQSEINQIVNQAVKSAIRESLHTIKTFYVDQIGGNDNNDGNSESPFKTFQKAVDSIPYGGSGRIVLKSDYTLDSYVVVHNKYVVLDLNGKTLGTQYYGVEYDHHRKYAIVLRSASVEVRNFGKLYVPPKPDGRPVAPPDMGLIGSGNTWATPHGTAFNSVVFVSWVGHVEHVWAEVHSGALVAYMEWDNGILAHTFVGVKSHYRGILSLGSGAYFIDTRGRPFTIGIGIFNDNWTGYIRRNGQNIPPSEAIAGIIRDVNGLPRNIVSNLIL